MGERLQHIEGMSRKEILQEQELSVLIALKEQMLEKLSELERDIHLVNDVIDELESENCVRGTE